MPKVKTDSSVRWKRCGLSSVPGQNSSTMSGRAGARSWDSSRLPQYTLAADAISSCSISVPSNACRNSSYRPAMRDHPLVQRSRILGRELRQLE